MPETVGSSDYSVVTSHESAEHSTPLVEKIYSGIGLYFAPNEKRINTRIQSIVDPSGNKQFIVGYHGETKTGGMLFERANADLRQAETLTPQQFAKMIGQVVSGVEFLDRYRIAHGDLHRIDNIFQFDGDLYKIGDFGLSKVVDKDEPVGNLEAFRASIFVYLGEKILGFEDVIDSIIDVRGEIVKSDRIDERFKASILKFLDTSSENLTPNVFRELATTLSQSMIDSWNMKN